MGPRGGHWFMGSHSPGGGVGGPVSVTRPCRDRASGGHCMNEQSGVTSGLYGHRAGV